MILQSHSYWDTCWGQWRCLEWEMESISLSALSLSPCVVIQQMIIAPWSFLFFLTVPKKLRVSFLLQCMPPFSW